MALDLLITLEEIDQKVVLRLEGRLDASSTPLLERKLEALIEEKHKMLLLDFGRIEYLSSAGLRLLLSMTKKLKAKEGAFILFSLTDEVSEVVKMAGFDRILHICPNEKEALQVNL